MKAVVTALKRSSDPIVLKRHLKILEEVLCPVDEFWNAFMEEGIFDGFINIFQKGNEAAIDGVSRQFIPFFSYMPERQDAAAKSGIGEAMLEALEKHSKSFKVLHEVCAILFYWPAMRGISEDSRAKIITTLAKSGLKHMEEETAAIDILSGVATVISYDRDNEERESEEVIKNQEAAFKAGILDVTAALMEKRAETDLLVFEYGGRIFGRICSDEERKEQAVKIKAIDLLAKGMKLAEEQGNCEVCEHITFALMKICGANEARTKLLKEAKVTPEQLRRDVESYYGWHGDQKHQEGLEDLAKQLEAVE